jgi:Trypsin-like peptidase domain
MLKSLVLLTTFLLFPPALRAQEADVYLIKMFDCAHKPTERTQTGFRVRGIKGLVTALHGVADCQKIMASSKNGLFLDQPLTIKKMDADHDVALLSSPQIDSAPDGGLNVADNVDWKSLGMVKVYGHPYGISKLETTLTLRNPPLTPLKDLVPSAPLSILKERRSPNHLINVLNLQGNLLPGHSGAPILDSKGNVVAVANGGLKEGFAGISWAVPYKDIEWDSLGSKLKVLAQIDPSLLFAADALPTVPPDEIRETFCEQVLRVVAESKTGFISIVGDPNLDDYAGMFKSKIELPGASSSFVEPNYSVTYFMYQTDKVGIIQSQYYNLVAKLTACLPAWERREVEHSDKSYKRYQFRENKKSPSIVISYNVQPSNLSSKHTLLLKIIMLDSSEFMWK